MQLICTYLYNDFIRPVGHEEQVKTRFRFQSSLSESEGEIEEELVEYTWIPTNGGDGGWVLHGMIRVWNGYGSGYGT